MRCRGGGPNNHGNRTFRSTSSESHFLPVVGKGL
uniref:Tospeak-9 n=2 Tax=Homininae TaxID=207598 RepID=F4YA21_HUMAN|nr:tospeak-9 [Homo sapiens]ADT65093.1 tospeak-1 [Pan troglodytes]